MFVKLTYVWEGDSVLVFRIHGDIKGLMEHVAQVRAGVMASTRAVAKAVVQANFPRILQPAADAKVEALVQEQLGKVEPGFAFFDEKLVEMKE